MLRGLASRFVYSEDAPESVDALIAEQKTFYELRAPDFGNASHPDRIGWTSLDPQVLRNVVDEFGPHGDVLELACGTGWLTRELARHADAVTAVDASEAMLDRAKEIDSDGVRFVHADIFEWTPDRAYDVVWFSNWLSHVPPTRFDAFWSFVASCLKPHGRVGFIDEDERATDNDEMITVGEVPVARRWLRDGSTHRVIKVFWRPEQLAARLEALGWTAQIRRLGESNLYGEAHRLDA